MRDLSLRSNTTERVICSSVVPRITTPTFGILSTERDWEPMMDIVELFGVLTQSGTQPNWSLELLTILADFGTSRLARRLVKLGPTVLSGIVNLQKKKFLLGSEILKIMINCYVGTSLAAKLSFIFWHFSKPSIH